MPSGRTHDSITLWSLPFVAGITFERTHSSNLTLLVSGGFLFSGLMFGPDLDIYSQQYRRWGLLRWIWLPYRKGLRHRSLWSHGVLVGTIVRVVYLGIWLSLFVAAGIAVVAIGLQMAGLTHNGSALAQQWLSQGMNALRRSVQQSPAEWIGLGIGLELGGLSHSLSDWASSTYQRWLKRKRKRSGSSASVAGPSIPSKPKTPPAAVPPPGSRTLHLPSFKRQIKD